MLDLLCQHIPDRYEHVVREILVRADACLNGPGRCSICHHVDRGPQPLRHTNATTAPQSTLDAGFGAPHAGIAGLPRLA